MNEQQGYRILALASRHLPPGLAKNVKLAKLERADIERDLTFLGLIIMENREGEHVDIYFQVIQDLFWIRRTSQLAQCWI